MQHWRLHPSSIPLSNVSFYVPILGSKKGTCLSDGPALRGFQKGKLTYSFERISCSSHLKSESAVVRVHWCDPGLRGWSVGWSPQNHPGWLLAVVQKKHHNPHVWAEWFLFWCPENKNENGKQVPLLAAQNWYFGWDNWREVQARWSFCLLCLFLSFSSSCLSVLDISLELAPYRKAGSYWQSVSH